MTLNNPGIYVGGGYAESISVYRRQKANYWLLQKIWGIFFTGRKTLGVRGSVLFGKLSKGMLYVTTLAAVE